MTAAHQGSPCPCRPIASTWLMPTLNPAERSNWLAAIGMNTASATSACTDLLLRIDWMLKKVRKVSGLSSEKTMTSRMRRIEQPPHRDRPGDDAPSRCARRLHCSCRASLTLGVVLRPRRPPSGAMMVSSSRGISRDDAAAAEDQGAVADALDLLEVGGDEKDRQPARSATAGGGGRSRPWSRRRRRWSAPRARAARTFASIQRATTTFCWLPPERVAIGRSGSGGLIEKRLQHRQAVGELAAGARSARRRLSRSRPGSCRCSRAPPCWRRGSPRRAGSRRSRSRSRMASAGSAGSTGRPSSEHRARPSAESGRRWRGRWCDGRRRASPTRPSVSPAATVKETGPTRSATASFDREDDAIGRRRRLDEGVGHRSADDLLDEIARRGLADRDGGHAPPVAEHGDAVGDAEDLVEAVGDIDDADAARAEAPERVEEMLDVGLGQRRRRLVEDEDVGLDGERAADRDERALGGGKRRDADVGVDVASHRSPARRARALRTCRHEIRPRRPRG